jgi:hypothetical protein
MIGIINFQEDGIKSLKEYHYIPSRTATIISTDFPNVGEDVEQLEPS